MTLPGSLMFPNLKALINMNSEVLLTPKPLLKQPREENLTNPGSVSEVQIAISFPSVFQNFQSMCILTQFSK